MPAGNLRHRRLLQDEYTISLYWHYAKALGGIRLQVSAEDVEDARAVLNEDAQSDVEAIPPSHERATERALRASVFGILLSPLELYALWLLLPVFGWSGRMSARERRNIVLAAVLIGLPFLASLLAFALKRISLMH